MWNLKEISQATWRTVAGNSINHHSNSTRTHTIQKAKWLSDDIRIAKQKSIKSGRMQQAWMRISKGQRVKTMKCTASRNAESWRRTKASSNASKGKNCLATNVIICRRAICHSWTRSRVGDEATAKQGRPRDGHNTYGFAGACPSQNLHSLLSVNLGNQHLTMGIWFFRVTVKCIHDRWARHS